MTEGHSGRTRPLPLSLGSLFPVCLRGIILIGLVDVGNPILTVGGTILWSGDPELSENREGELGTRLHPLADAE